MEMVGICGVGSYLPEKKVDAWEAVRESGISREKFDSIGARDLHLAAEGEMPSSMAVAAAQVALADAGLEPKDVDLIIYTGSVKDHSRWQASNKVQADLDASNSYVFDLYQGSAGQNLALSVGRSMIDDDPEVNTVLIAAAERWDSSLDRPIIEKSFVVGDGGSAAVLRRQHPELVHLATASTCRGEHHQAYCIPDVGASVRLTPEVFARGGHLYQQYRPVARTQKDPSAFVEEFMEIGQQTFAEAARRAEVSISAVDYVITINSSKRHNQAFLARMGLAERASSIEAVAETGLLGTADAFYNLARARSRGELKKGDLIAVYTVAGGYSWSVSLLRA